MQTPGVTRGRGCANCSRVSVEYAWMEIVVLLLVLSCEAIRIFSNSFPSFLTIVSIIDPDRYIKQSNYSI